MQLEHSEDVRLTSHRLLDILSVLVEYIFPAGDDLRDDGEAVACWSLGKDRAVSSLLHLIFEDPSFRDRHGRGLRPVALPRCVRHNFLLSILTRKLGCDDRGCFKRLAAVRCAFRMTP